MSNTAGMFTRQYFHGTRANPLRVVAEVTKWQGHSPERLQQMKDNLTGMKAQGTNVIID